MCHGNVLRVFVIVSGPFGNPESSSVHRRSPKSINQKPNSKFLGLSLSTRVWSFHYRRDIFIRFIVFISYFTHTEYRYRNHCDMWRKNTIKLFYMNKSVTRGTTLIFKRVEIYTTNVDFI